jgi:hypothetical protein
MLERLVRDDLVSRDNRKLKTPHPKGRSSWGPSWVSVTPRSHHSKLNTSDEQSQASHKERLASPVIAKQRQSAGVRAPRYHWLRSWSKMADVFVQEWHGRMRLVPDVGRTHAACVKCGTKAVSWPAALLDNAFAVIQVGSMWFRNHHIPQEELQSCQPNRPDSQESQS